MAFIRQRGKKDCGVAVLAMLCNVTYEAAYRAIPWRREGILYGTSTTMLRQGGIKLGYRTESTPQHRLKVVRQKAFWEELPPPSISDLWYLVPDNSLVKVPHPIEERNWHWVAWRKDHIYDPARGVFHPSKYGVKPTAYMEFIKEDDDG